MAIRYTFVKQLPESLIDNFSAYMGIIDMLDISDRYCLTYTLADITDNNDGTVTISDIFEFADEETHINFQNEIKLALPHTLEEMHVWCATYNTTITQTVVSLPDLTPIDIPASSYWI